MKRGENRCRLCTQFRAVEDLRVFVVNNYYRLGKVCKTCLKILTGDNIFYEERIEGLKRISLKEVIEYSKEEVVDASFEVVNE